MFRSLRAGFVPDQTLRGAETSAANDIPHLVCFTVFSSFSRFRRTCQIVCAEQCSYPSQDRTFFNFIITKKEAYVDDRMMPWFFLPAKGIPTYRKCRNQPASPECKHDIIGSGITYPSCFLIAPAGRSIVFISKQKHFAAAQGFRMFVNKPDKFRSIALVLPSFHNINCV